MNISELLTQAKPILFNTEMVRAILEGRKTQTRRVLKTKKYVPNDAMFGYTMFTPEGSISCRGTFIVDNDKRYGENFIKLPYKSGDILYVRETFFEHRGKYKYKADGKHLLLNKIIGGKEFFKWKPSIHMPKEAARIFLRVTGVRAERLQDITAAECVKEGIPKESLIEVGENFTIGQFDDLWNSTIKKKDLPLYGWKANPWVWVYEFERIEVKE